MSSPETFECSPCIEPSPPSVEFELFTEQINARAGGQAWYPGAWQINMGGNGRAITLRPAENIFHIAASSWNIPVNDPLNGNIGIPGWNRGARACTGYNDQFGNTQQYCSVWEQVNGTLAGNYRNRTWEAWNPEGLHGSNAEYNSSVYSPEQCERWSDILAWDANENGARLENMLNSRSGSHGCGVHRFGIDPWRVSGGENWTAHAGKVCPGTARVNQLNSIVARAIVIRNAVRAGRCGYLPKGRVNLREALARTGNTPTDWFDMATTQDLENALANVLGRGGRVNGYYLVDVVGAMSEQLTALQNRVNALEAALPKAVWDHLVPSFVSNDEQQARNMLAWTNQRVEEIKAILAAPKN